MEADNVGDEVQVTTPMAWYGVMVVEVWGAGLTYVGRHGWGVRPSCSGGWLMLKGSHWHS